MIWCYGRIIRQRVCGLSKDIRPLKSALGTSEIHETVDGRCEEILTIHMMILVRGL